jgi:hypothetical protein
VGVLFLVWSCFERDREMAGQDAWIREAEEALMLVEDFENRIKNRK